MPLESSTATLAMDIETAYQAVKENGAQDGASPADIIAQLGEDLATAIHTYMLTALVNTDVTVDTSAPDSAGGVTNNQPPGSFGVGGLS
tara:strand:- start:191 stop:457 length:267 start_codon:yes stop_codon:yes gene_type:complete